MPALELDLDLGEGLVDPEPALDQAVVDPDHEDHRDDDDRDDDDQSGDQVPSSGRAAPKAATHPCQSSSGEAGGRYWTRTSDILGVNEAL